MDPLTVEIGTIAFYGRVHLIGVWVEHHSQNGPVVVREPDGCDTRRNVSDEVGGPVYGVHDPAILRIRVVVIALLSDECGSRKKCQ